MAETTGIIEAGKALGYEGESKGICKGGTRQFKGRESDGEGEANEREGKRKEARGFKLREEREREASEFELKKMDLASKGWVALGSHRPRGPKIPPFDEAHDEMDNYLKRF